MFPDLRQIYRRSFISHTNLGLGPHTGSGRTHPEPEPKTASFRLV